VNVDFVERCDHYVLISPCRDEAEFIRRSVESVLRQTLLPSAWIIVDDGSTDGSGELLEEYSRQLPWLRVIKRVDRGTRSVGPGVVEAFEQGLQCVELDRFEYLCKFDLDVEIPERYFETLVDRMTEDSRLGSCSGKPYCRVGNTLVEEKCGDEMSVGMTKFYRTECFRQIGGFVRGVMWDGIDCHRARMLGWIVASWDEEELRFLHLRAMGSSERGLLRGRMRHGYGQYFMGTGFVYMLVSAIYRIGQKPVCLGGFAMLLGYLRSWWRRVERYEDAAFRSFLRAYQRDCLLRGKRAATLRLDAQARLTHFKSAVWGSLR
jgi:biofilm PGA synthesis N-glycosyltransferase PgaC